MFSEELEDEVSAVRVETWDVEAVELSPSAVVNDGEEVGAKPVLEPDSLTQPPASELGANSP